MIELNKLEEAVYKYYSGYACEQLPLLYEEGREFMNFSEIVERRLDLLKEGTPKAIRDSWWVANFSVGDLLLRHPDGRGKMVLYDENVKNLLKTINKNTKFFEEKILLSEEQYENFKGYELTKKQIKQSELKPISNPITEEILKFIIRDSKLFLPYVEESKKIFPNSKQLLGFAFTDALKKPIASLWQIGSDNGPCCNLAQYSKYLGLSTKDGYSSLVGVSPYKKFSA